MKKFKTLLLLFIFNYNFVLFSQEIGGGEYNKTSIPCLTDAQRENIIVNLKKSQKYLKAQNKLIVANKQTNNTLFIWPVKKANHVKYNEIWFIRNYVDHNTAYPNQITDYNGGSKSYDTQSGYNHQGLDISIWPYSHRMLENDGLQVIAASGGQIIYKSDGQFDRSCSFNNNLWNALYIQHADGSVAWYGHLKDGSLTSKGVGDMVAQGEYLGIVGSSGNSTGPHLHFEVYENSNYSYGNLIDPYSGNSNNWNATSWWVDQKPYKNPTINALTTNMNPPNFGSCPETEITNEQDNFAINELVYFVVFLKDQFEKSFNLKVYKPDNSVFYSWDRNLTKDFITSYWWYSGTVDDTEGEWRVECTLSTGAVVTHYFTVGNVLSTSDKPIDRISIYPNPINDELYISSEIRIDEIMIIDNLGKIIFKDKNSFKGIKNLSTDSFAKGVYFLSIKDQNLKTQVHKVMKQ